MMATQLFELMLKDANIEQPEKEVRLINGRMFRFDYVWEKQKVVLEVHGGVFQNGRHTRGVGFTNDREKMNEAQLLGYTVIEATSEQVKTGQAIQWIVRAINKANENG